MPRSLRWRIGLAFGLLAFTVLLGVGAALFVVLRTLHADSTNARLADLSGTLVAEVRNVAAGTTPADTLALLRGQVADLDVSLYILMANGRLVNLQGSPLPRDAITVPSNAIRDQTERGTVRFTDGATYAYAATVLRNESAAGTRALVVATPDRSGAEAARDLLTALPAVLVVLLLIGVPIAWLLSRSVTSPLRRLAAAAADPSSAAGHPLPLTGPSEVRELTARFNEMSGELEATRRREAELLANLRHDLRTPLTVIAGFATALTDGTATGEDAGRAARAIGEEAARLERMVGELGAIDRLRAGGAGLRPEILDVGAVLGETVDRFRSRADAKGVELAIVGVEGGSLAMTADRVAVDRILGNLVENALAATSTGGHVWIAGRGWDVPDGPRHTRPAVVLSVTDDGPGFPPGASDRVFDRFYRADPARPKGGSGLGLTIVRELARAHGGNAWAENVAPHGGRVSVVLPVIAAVSNPDGVPAAAGVASPRPGAAGAARGGRPGAAGGPTPGSPATSPANEPGGAG